MGLRYDVFLSYSRSEAGRKYTKQLRDHLKKLDFTVFLDETEIHAGDPLRRALEQALDRSRTLAIIGTPEAAKSPFVALEVEHFARNTKRKIIPINIGGSMSDPPWQVVRERDLVWIDDTSEALAHGSPSLKVAEEINRLFEFRKRNVVRRLQTIGVALLFIVVAAVAGIVIQQQIARRKEASAEAKRRKADAEAAEKRAKDAETQSRQSIELAKLRAAEAAKSEVLAHERLVDIRQEQGRFELLRGNRQQALVSLAAVYRERPDDNVVRALVAAATRGLVTRINSGGANIVAAAWSGDRRRIVALSEPKPWDTVDRCRKECGFLVDAFCEDDCTRKALDATLWDGEGRLLTTLRGSLIASKHFAFAEGGSRILTLGLKGVTVWDARDGRETGKLAGLAGVEIGPMLPSRKHHRLLVATPDKTYLGHLAPERLAYLVDLKNGTVVRTFADVLSCGDHCHNDEPIFFNADGTIGGVRDAKGAVHLFRTEDGKDVQTFDAAAYTAAALSADGKRIALAAGKKVFLHDVASKEELAAANINSGEEEKHAVGLDFHPEGTRILLTISGGFTQWALDDETGGWSTLTWAHVAAAASSKFVYSPDGQRIVASDGTVFAMDANSPLDSFDDDVSLVAAQLSDDGAWLMTASNDGIRLWDAVNGGPSITRYRSKIDHPFALSRDGRRVVVVAHGTASLYEVQTGRLLHGPVRYTWDDAEAIAGVFVNASADGMTAVVTDRGNYLIDFSKSQADPLEPPNKQMFISADGKKVAIADRYDSDGLDHVPDNPFSPKPSAGARAVSDDGRLLATCPPNGPIQLWSLPDRKLLHTLEVTTAYDFDKTTDPDRLDFDPSGERLVSFDKQGVKIFDVRHGSLIALLRVPNLALQTIRFVGDGDAVVAFSSGAEKLDSAVSLWLTPREHRSPSQIERLLARIPREVRATVEASLATAPKTSP